MNNLIKRISPNKKNLKYWIYGLLISIFGIINIINVSFVGGIILTIIEIFVVLGIIKYKHKISGKKTEKFISYDEE